MHGPYPIFCRGHSGGRLLCEAFIRNGIDMGHVDPERKDTPFFSPAHNARIREIILNAYRYEQLAATERQYYQNLLRTCVEDYLKTEIANPQRPFGWKLGVSLFTLPVVLETFPTAKIIHLIRDGRDVMLSRLEARFGHLDDPLNKLVVFGETCVDSFAGQPLTPATIAAHRNELEMQHWVTAVRYGRRGQIYPDRYLEVKYEILCRHPVDEFAKIFDFLGVSFHTDTRDWLKQAAYTTRIAKWQALSPTELERPLQIGAPLLTELGYLEPCQNIGFS